MLASALIAQVADIIKEAEDDVNVNLVDLDGDVFDIESVTYDRVRDTILLTARDEDAEEDEEDDEDDDDPYEDENVSKVEKQAQADFVADPTANPFEDDPRGKSEEKLQG